RNALADIGEALAPADRARSHLERIGEDRHAFARMIGAFPGRIAAVVGGEDEKIAGPEKRERLGYALIEGLECGRISFDIAAVAMERIEIDEIGHCQSAVLERRPGFE